MVPTLSLADQVDKIAERLEAEFSGEVPAQTVRTMVHQVYGEMAAARVTQFVPVFVARQVRAALRDQAVRPGA